MFRLASATLAVAAIVGTSAAAQPFQYDARWFVGVRDNVLTIQERQRARIDAIERRRNDDQRSKVDAKAAESRSQATQSASVSAPALPTQ